MSISIITVLTIATLINLFTIKWKLKRARYSDIAIEIGIIIALTFLFQGTLTGMAIATSVSAFWSIWTIIFPSKKAKA